VKFDISPLPGNGGSRRWLATYSNQRKTAKFTIEIGSETPMGPEDGETLGMLSCKGAILSMPGSDASDMLVALGKALKAKHQPPNIRRTSRLPFDCVILGDHLSQSQDSHGGFTSEPGGNWTATKITIDNKDAEYEVYLDLNPVSRKAQFSGEGNDGGAVVAKLATVL
jgi:hypothetical protein